MVAQGFGIGISEALLSTFPTFFLPRDRNRSSFRNMLIFLFSKPRTVVEAQKLNNPKCYVLSEFCRTETPEVLH
jgi:hypothetical protein